MPMNIADEVVHEMYLHTNLNYLCAAKMQGHYSSAPDAWQQNQDIKKGDFSVSFDKINFIVL